MSFFCSDCQLPRGRRLPVCLCCPTAEYYRDQYEIDECGRPFIRNINIPLPINLPQLNFTAYGYYFSTFTTEVPPMNNIPLNAIGTQSFINANLPEIVIVKPGRYLVNYLVFSTNGGNIAIRLGSGIVSGTAVHGDDLISGSAIINVGFIPAELSIINAGPFNINTAVVNALDGVSAQLSISEII